MNENTRRIFPRSHRSCAIAVAIGLAIFAPMLHAHEHGEGVRPKPVAAQPVRPPSPLVSAPEVEGSWSTLPYLMPINPIHVGLLHTGKVLIVAGSENERGQYGVGDYYGGVWDPLQGTIVVQTLLWDVFCTGMAAMPDGRFLIIGGTRSYEPFEGLSLTTVFDPATEKFAQLEDMAHGRWYGTSTILSDGGLMAFSGENEVHQVNNAVEIYHAGLGWSAEVIAPFTPSLYPRMHVLPNGDVFVSGMLPKSSVFHTSSQTWDANIYQTVLNLNRKGGSSVLLPLRPETGYLPKVMILGGLSPATATAEIIDLSVATPAWRSTAPMSLPRIRMNAVILPTGKVLALGGSRIDEDASTASLAADLFDPTTETWSSAGVAVYPRLYHSSALLLPDATVWVAGSNPTDLWEEHMEIYSPAYLFTTDGQGNTIPAVRPTITTVPAEVGYGAPLTITTPDSANIGQVVLVRPGSASHSFDFEQRLVGLSFTALVAGQLKAVAPPNGSIAPPGYYMVFIVNQAGVPSIAQFVHLSSNPTNKPPKGSITAPTDDQTILPGESVSFAGMASDPYGTVASYRWVFPGGAPAISSLQSPGPVSFATPGTYIVSMTAVDDAGANDPSPPTRSILVQNTDPPLEVSITQPPAGSTVKGKKIAVSISVTGTEEGTSNTFTFSVDGTVVSIRALVSSETTFSWSTTSYSAGAHTLSAAVKDYEGRTGSVSEQVTLIK